MFLEGNAINFAKFDSKVMDRAIEALGSGGLPDILTVYFAGADGVAHRFGTGAALYLEKVIDPQVGRLIDTLAALDADWRNHTLFILTADHGRTDAPPIAEDDLIETEIEEALARAGPSWKHSRSRPRRAARPGLGSYQLRPVPRADLDIGHRPDCGCLPGLPADRRDGRRSGRIAQGLATVNRAVGPVTGVSTFWSTWGL